MKIEITKTSKKKEEVEVKITQIEYERVSNLGNYETERLRAVASISENQDVDAVYAAIEQWVESKLGK